MEIDPEVAELLGDLPPTKLPMECEAAGWGHNTMREMIKCGQAPPRAPTEGEHQPTYEDNCVQCGRPITLDRDNKWMDHAGKSWCDRGLTNKNEFATNYHVTQHEYDLLARATPPPPSYVYMPIRVSPPIVAARAAKKKKGHCSATKHKTTCSHKCSHDDGHFGFHECKYCRHLWR